MFEMNEKQKALFDALKPLQQKVCLNVISGMSDIDSYEKAGGKATNKESARASVSKMLTNVNVVNFLDEFKAIAVNKAIMSREEMMETLTALSKVDLSRLDKLTPEMMEGLESSFGVKLKAMNQLADLGGYKSANKLDLSSSDGTMTPKNFNDFYSDEE